MASFCANYHLWKNLFRLTWEMQVLSFYFVCLQLSVNLSHNYMLYDKIISTDENLLLLNFVNNKHMIVKYMWQGKLTVTSVHVTSVCLAGLTIKMYEGRLCDSGHRKVSTKQSILRGLILEKIWAFHWDKQTCPLYIWVSILSGCPYIGVQHY